MDQIELRPFSEKEYHQFFRDYVPDPLMNASPFRYNREQISRSYRYNYGGFQEHYAHFGIFKAYQPVGSFQLKRMNEQKGSCEFGIILQHDGVKNLGIGTRAIQIGMAIAREQYGMQTILGDTMGRNKRMIHVFEKLGFQLVECCPGAYELPDGSREDRLVYQKRLTEEIS